MGTSLFALMDDNLIPAYEIEPILANLCGQPSVAAVTGTNMRKARDSRIERLALSHQMTQEAIHERKSRFGKETEKRASLVDRRANFRIEYPLLRDFEDLGAFIGTRYEYPLPLDQIPVIVGFGEVGPFGSSRT